MKRQMNSALKRVQAALSGWFMPSGGGDSRVIHVSGATITENKLLRLSAAWACTRLISETIATLPLGMNERTATGKRYAPEHWLHRLIHSQPNADSTASVFWESVVAAMLLRDGARVEKLMIGSRIVGLRFLAPNRLSWSRLSDGSKRYRYIDDNGLQREIPSDRIWYIPGFSLDGKNGVSVVEYGVQVFGNATAADEAAGRTFKTGLMQTLYYKVANWLTPEQRAIFKAEVRGSVERGEEPVLEGGIDVGAVGIKPSDAQLLESRAFSVEEICRWFRVPP